MGDDNNSSYPAPAYNYDVEQLFCHPSLGILAVAIHSTTKMYTSETSKTFTAIACYPVITNFMFREINCKVHEFRK